MSNSNLKPDTDFISPSLSYTSVYRPLTSSALQCSLQRNNNNNNNNNIIIIIIIIINFVPNFITNIIIHFNIILRKSSSILLLLSSSSSSSPLCRVFILIFLIQTISLGNTVLQLFCCYYSWCLYR